jgi:hypothetical protein
MGAALRYKQVAALRLDCAVLFSIPLGKSQLRRTNEILTFAA